MAYVYNFKPSELIPETILEDDDHRDGCVHDVSESTHSFEQGNRYAMTFDLDNTDRPLRTATALEQSCSAAVFQRLGLDKPNAVWVEL